MFSPNTKEAAANTADQARKTYVNAKNDIDHSAGQIKNDLSHVAANAGKQIRGFIDNASDQINDASGKITSEVRSNPLRSSFIALGIGFVLGLFARRS